MKRTGLILIIAALFSGIAGAAKNIESLKDITPVRALFEEPSLYDGQRLTVQGEVIGDIMRDGETFWINIKDGDFFIGVVIDGFQKDMIRYLGRYGIRGDIVKVSGTYHLHCPLHYGERDIHAEQLEIVENGYKMQETVQRDRVILVLLLGIFTIFILPYTYRKHIQKDTDGLRK